MLIVVQSGTGTRSQAQSEDVDGRKYGYAYDVETACTANRIALHGIYSLCLAHPTSQTFQERGAQLRKREWKDIVNASIMPQLKSNILQKKKVHEANASTPLRHFPYPNTALTSRLMQTRTILVHESYPTRKCK